MASELDNIPRYTQAPVPPRIGKVPFPFVSLGIISVFASWIPLVYFARARATLSKEPRVAIFQDMGVQPKYREQQSSEIFADGRADRPQIVGTVARGRLEADDHYYRGFTMESTGSTTQPFTPKFFEDFPPQVKVDAKLLARGQERFNIYCSVCHGLDGYGHGAINERAQELMQQDPPHATNWVPAANLTADPAKSRPVGHLYNTINVGIRNMPGYGPQIPVEDRWAIVAYVRALQLAQDVNPKYVSDEVKNAPETK
jgi:mono/diheme cytochrome c family protein